MLATPLNVEWPQEKTRELSLTGMLSLSDWRRFVPETVGLFVAMSLISLLLAGRGCPSSAFWIPVLLMSGQYGIMGGLFSAIVASFVLYIGGLPPQTAAQDFYAYAAVVAALPSAWFAAALVFGGLRTLHIHHETGLKDRLAQSHLTAVDLADALERSLEEVQRLEQRIAGDSSTLASLLHSLAKLDMHDACSLIGSMADVVRYGVGANSFAIYLNGRSGPEPCLGVQDGMRLAPEAIPPLAPELAAVLVGRSAGVDAATGDTKADDPTWQAIHLAGSAKPLGIVVCACLLPARDRAIARRRLHEICDVLAVLLSAFPRQTTVAHAMQASWALAYEAP